MSTKPTATGDDFDPVLLAVISNRLTGIVREMTNTLLRTGRSAIINTCRDFSCAIVTAQHELVTAAEGLPIHVMGAEYLTKAIDRFHGDLKEGDAFLHNDPYNGNTHHADYNVLIPVFHEGTHIYTVCAKSHQADCGNSRPTTYATYARDIYEEGALNFPCVKIQEDYTDNQDFIRMCMNRIRVPDQWYGDYLATLGAARVGEAAVKALAAKYGNEVLGGFNSAWFDYSERRMAEAIRSMPAATLTGAGAHDPVPGMPEGIPLNVEIEIDPARAMVDLDLRDNIDCVPNGFNLSEACAMASTVIGFFNSLPEPVPHNHGSFRRIRVHLRENSVAGIPRHPASCSVATTNVAERVVNITQATLASLGDGFGLAEGAMGQGPGLGVIAGMDARRPGADEVEYINQLLFSYYGGPAGPREDGWVTYLSPVNGGLGYRDSVEIAEQKYPILIDELRLLQDREGAGRFRGAPASRFAFGPTTRPLTIAFTAEGFVNPPRGVRGGEPGEAHDVFIVEADGTRREVEKVAQLELQPGERIVDLGSGGGGYGSPLERDPKRVLADVVAEFITPERARSKYGVVIEEAGSHYSIDDAATAELRASLAPVGG